MATVQISKFDLTTIKATAQYLSALAKLHFSAGLRT